MEHCSKKPGDEKKIPPFGPDSIELAMRLRIRDTIEALVKEELDAALGAMKSVRVGETRQGYRHGTRERTLTTSRGPTTIAMPRARVQQPEGDAAAELFTFLRFPSSQWKALRTTNALERINEEFRRRTKTQASLPGHEAVVLLLFGSPYSLPSPYSLFPPLTAVSDCA